MAGLLDGAFETRTRYEFFSGLDHYGVLKILEEYQSGDAATATWTVRSMGLDSSEFFWMLLQRPCPK